MNPDFRNEIEYDLGNMKRIVDESAALLTKLKFKEPDTIEKTALSAFASQFYNGIENILKRMHKYFLIPLPTGENWHHQLLLRFSSESDFKVPIKFSPELFDYLNDLRRFRHYFFHGYSLNIDWSILNESMLVLDDYYNTFLNELKSLMD